MYPHQFEKFSKAWQDHLPLVRILSVWSCTFRKQSTASIELNISGVMNVVLLQNTLSYKRLNPHQEQGGPHLNLGHAEL